MFIDITQEVSPEILENAGINDKKGLIGHIGTHFDVMDKEFPLSYLERKAVLFDVSEVKNRDIEEKDININLVKPDMFIAFYTGFIEETAYGTKDYFKNHPQLSEHLIDSLLEKNISIIGIDFAGVRRGNEHTPKDQYCADKGVFIIENLCNLKKILGSKKYADFTANTYPVKYSGISGLPCRVIAKV